MREKIIVFMLMLAMIIPFAEAVVLNEISYSVKMRFDKEHAFPESAKLVQGTAAEDDRTVNHTYMLQLTSFKGEKLDYRGFNLPNYWFDINVYVENGTFVMFLPYHTNAEKIEVYREGRKISELDVSEFASCNQDGFCSVTENSKECPEDCTIEEVGAEEGFTEEELAAEGIPEEKPVTSQGIIALIAVLALALIVLIYLATRKVVPKKR